MQQLKILQYMKTRPEIDPISNNEVKFSMALLNFNMPMAMIAPGIEYPKVAT